MLSPNSLEYYDPPLLFAAVLVRYMKYIILCLFVCI